MDLHIIHYLNVAIILHHRSIDIVVVIVFLQRRRFSTIFLFISFIITFILTLEGFVLVCFDFSFLHSFDKINELQIFPFLILALFFLVWLLVDYCAAVHGAVFDFCVPFVQILHDFEINKNSQIPLFELSFVIKLHKQGLNYFVVLLLYLFI